MRKSNMPESDYVSDVKSVQKACHPEIEERGWERLTKAREAAGLSQAELARRVRMSPITINKWEHGEAPEYVYTFLTLSKVLDVSLDYLFYNEVDGENSIPPRERKILREAGEVLCKIYGLDYKGE